MKKGRKKARKNDEPGFYNTEICSVRKAPTKGYSRKRWQEYCSQKALPKGTGRKQTLGIECGQRCHYECEP